MRHIQWGILLGFLLLAVACTGAQRAAAPPAATVVLQDQPPENVSMEADVKPAPFRDSIRPHFHAVGKMAAPSRCGERRTGL
jgi:hypothetical protein